MALPTFNFLLVLSSLAAPTVNGAYTGSLQGSDTSGSPRPSRPHLGDDGRVYFCHGKTLVALDPNGTVAFSVALGLSCRPDLAPVTDGYRKIYLIAEDRVIRVIPSHIATYEPSMEILLGPESTFGVSGRIIGICISIWSAAMFVNIERRGIFAFGLRGQPLWSAGPLLYRFGYLQGCMQNTTDCYFSLPPSCDQCEGTLYLSNNQGQLYCMYTRSPNFKWIQDLSSVDVHFTVTPGNNGRLYVTFPRKAVLMALDASSGEILWRNSIGPLSSEDCTPTVDFNGWVSIGSLDGYLYSFSPTGLLKKFLKYTATDSSIHVSPSLDHSGFALYISQTRMQSKTSHSFSEYMYISAMEPIHILFTALVPATGVVYWTEKYPDNGKLSSFLSASDLHYFRFDERVLLAVLASSGIGKSSHFFSTRQKLEWTCSQSRHNYPDIYTGNERTVLVFLVFQLFMIILMALSVRFCYIFWQKRKLKEHTLSSFITRRHTLHMRRKACIKKISELELEATTDNAGIQAVEELENAVRVKELVEKKLSTTYSLGRDRSAGLEKSLLPLYEGKSRSYSFHSRSKESLTIFNTFSDTSTMSGGSENDSDGSSGGCEMSSHAEMKGELEMVMKGKAPLVPEPSTSSIKDGGGFDKSSEEMGMRKKRMWLTRRTLSSAN